MRIGVLHIIKGENKFEARVDLGANSTISGYGPYARKAIMDDYERLLAREAFTAGLATGHTVSSVDEAFADYWANRAGTEAKP
jgi:hypothetical protein